MNTKFLLVAQSVLLFMLILVVMMGIGLLYLAPPRPAKTLDAESTAIPTATPAPAPQSATTQWEYLSVDYGQHTILGTQYDINAEVSRYELVDVADPYGSMFLDLLTKGCTITKDILFDTEAQTCIGKNFIGREFVLSVLGKDGWELVAFDNHSTEYSYQVDMLFKRPLNPCDGTTPCT
jgi:hypothetical protein